MSRFTRYATTSQTLSLTAMEEASRRGMREADLQDLFLALVLSDQMAGQVLRDLGMSIQGVRAALHDHQQEQIASLGIAVSLPAPENIVFHETGGYAWSKRASDLIARAGKRGRTADAGAVLRELLNEPSGLVADLLKRLGTTPAEVLTRLDVASAGASTGASAAASTGMDAAPAKKGEVSAGIESFIPAPAQSVRAFLSDPARVPEWEPMIGAVEASGATALPVTTPLAEPDAQGGGIWLAHASMVRADGKRLNVKPRFRQRTIEFLPHGMQSGWRFAYPDAPASPPITVTFSLTPATGGTHLRTTMTWTSRGGIRVLLRPLQRFLIWIRLTQVTAAISRAFR